LLSAIALVFGFVGSMPLAGPIAVMVVSRAAASRFREALSLAFGASAADALYAGTAFFGYLTFLSRHPLVVPLSHAMTAAIFVGLGSFFAFFCPAKKGDKRASRVGTVLFGFAISAANPTLLFTWGAAVAFLYTRGLAGRSEAAAIPFGLSAGLGAAAWNVVLVGLLRRYGGKLPRGALTWTVRALGLVLVALGIWSVAKLVPWMHGHAPISAPSAARL
jgi:threonine/homoserine/homoserine lactone efflux protein